MNYNEFRTKQSEDFKAIPIFFAFTKQQLSDELERFGVTVDDICSMGAGGFMRKADRHLFDEFFTNQEIELAQHMDNDKFMIDAIEYELANHEYCITYDSSDALGVLGLSLENDRVKRNFKIARDRYLAGVN